MFVVDASSSMRRESRLGVVKTLLLAYVSEAHQRRERVALVTFRHDRSRLVCPFTVNVSRTERAIRGLELGGRTPLAEGLTLGWRALRQERCKDPDRELVMAILSDGRPNMTITGRHPFDEAVTTAERLRASGVTLAFIDGEDDPMASGCGYAVASAAGGIYEFLTSIIRRRRAIAGR
jgi:magnesium chelatase subunit D